MMRQGHSSLKAAISASACAAQNRVLSPRSLTPNGSLS